MYGRLRAALKWLARTALFPAAERGWELGFLLASMLLRPSIRRVVPTGSERVLVVAPHPDDETLACGGSLARHVAAGERTCVLVVTDGGSSRAGGVGRDEMRRLRTAEAKAAMEVFGGVDLVQLGLPEDRWSPGDLLSCLESVVRREQPAIVYAPSCVDFHPEHIKVARALAQVLRSLAGVTRPKIRVYELQVPLTPVLANVAVEMRGKPAASKGKALAQYRTQQGSFGWVRRHSRYLRRLYRIQTPVEVFWEMDAESYCRLMELNLRRSKYRSIRPRPFGDGLAWLVGLRERRQLKKLLRSHSVT